MVRPFKFTLAVAFAAAVTSCASTVSTRFQDAAVHSTGNERPFALCAGFRLTDEEAQRFLNRSKPINAQQMHDHYNYQPCFVKGRVAKVEQSRQFCDFIIRAGGTAELACEDGEAYIYACDTCDDLLKDRSETAE